MKLNSSKWLRHMAWTGLSAPSLLPKFLGRIVVCKEHMPSSTLRRVRLKRGKEKDYNMLVVNARILFRDRSQEGPVIAAEG